MQRSWVAKVVPRSFVPGDTTEDVGMGGAGGWRVEEGRGSEEE